MESVKEIADRIFKVNASPDPIPLREISLEEMSSYRAQSEQKLKEKRSKRKSSARKESTEDIGDPCPACGMKHWDVFPDGRKYCLECGAVMEIDGTVTGGAIKKELLKQINGIDENMVIVEFKCNECGEVIQVQGKDLEVAKKKVILHKAYDSKSQCSGTFTFLRQVFPDHENTPSLETNEETEIADTFMNALGRGKNPESKNSEIEKGKRFEHPKREKFVCYKCDWGNCPQTYDDAIVCLLINIDMKLKKLLERWPQ
jgi:hypothetical protein